MRCAFGRQRTDHRAASPAQRFFSRWNIKGRAPQLLAANLDHLILVTTPDEPPFRPRFIDRELAQAEAQEISPVIVCNKCDLPAAQEPAFQERLANWESLGYTVLRVSAKTQQGMDALARILAEKTCAFVGQSGVGKSSLINALDEACTLRTGTLSQKYGRGAHTTTKGILLHLHLPQTAEKPQGTQASVIDTPGVRRFILHDIPAQELALYFRDLQPYVGQCTFGMSCTHTTERGCRILEALKNGDVNADRYDSWKRICQEIKTGNFED